MVKLDTDKTGFEMLYHPWLAPWVEHMLQSGEEMGTREAQLYIRGTGHEISRASVINALNSLAEEGVILKKEITGKGGYRGIYWRASDTYNFWRDLALVLKSCIIGASGDPHIWQTLEI